MEKVNTLYVQMFGNYQIRYNGYPLTGGKIRDTQFTGLMQMLFHHVSGGVARDCLEDALLGDRDVENRHQALQTIVYKAKKKLKNMGLPEENYIVLEKGVYFWTSQIPVVEDAAVFDDFFNRAELSEEKEEKLTLYLEACYTYQGEFLPMHTAVLWASAEARRYRKQFCICAERAAEILREKEDWVRLEELGRYASGIVPYSDWESLTMEALIKRGRIEEARKLYADTVDGYLNEQGVYPSAKMMDMMEKLGNQIRHSYEVLDHIQKGLTENQEDILGGYQCSYPVFCGIYHMIGRMMERGGQSVYLMLCTLVDSKDNPMKEGKRLEETSVRLREAIQMSIRHGDIINQYGNGQFLILLVNTTREDCEIVKKRINQKFMMGRQRIHVQYHVNNVICTI